MKKEILLALLLGAVLLVAGCVSPQGGPSAARVDVVDEGGDEEPAATEEPTGGEIKEFTLTAKQWDFNPSTITVNKGDMVKLSITSIDVAHGFAISAFGVNSRLNPGQTTNVEFVADKSGTFPFFCSVQCGRGHTGMRGTLIVN